METSKRRKKEQSSDDENILLAYGTLRRPFKKSINKKLKTNLNNLWRKSFNELNFLDSYCKLKSSPSQSADDMESLSTVTLESSFDLNDDPEKVADCLNDLDAYLDAIDGESSKTNSCNNITDSNDLDDLLSRSHHVKTPRNNFSTYPKKKKRIASPDRECVDETLSPSTSSTLSASFQRHQPHRNTILTSTKLCNHSEEGSCATTPRTKNSSDTQRRLSWLRNSMRKTRPILMPDHVDADPQLISTQQSNSPVNTNNSNDISNADDNFEEEPPPPDYVTSTSNNNSNVDDIGIDDRVPIIQNELLQTSDLSSNSNNTRVVDSNFPLEIFENSTELRGIERPRQMGRRSEMIPRLVSITAETNNGSQNIILNHQRPQSAPEPGTVRTSSSSSPPSQRRYVESEISSVGTSRNPSPVSIVSSTGSSSMASAVDSSERPRERLSSSSSDQDEPVGEADDRDTYRKWPHQYGRALATICCTLGLFNVSRFAVFSIHYGANFIVQFLILSILIGIPMLWLQMCLGAKLRKGPISMWCISPICKGISISLFIAQGLISLYTTVSLGWLIIYFRDSLLSKSENYRWEEIYELYRGYGNESVTLSERISDYFNGVVLQRIQLGPGGRAGATGIGPVRFQLAFNLSLLWMFVFVILCKGLRSYGKCLIFLSIAPLALLLVVTIKFLTIVELSTFQNLFPATDWQEFFSNSQSWATAAQETFLTWNLLGISVLSLCSKTNKTLTKNKHLLKRDGFIIIIVTIFGLLVAAVLGNVCVKILFSRGYIYTSSSSYESLNSDIFLYRRSSPIAPPIMHPIPIKYLPRYASVLGETFHQIGVNYNSESGYQVLRLVTEILPPTFSLAIDDMSSIWCMLTFLALILLGIGQLAAMWKPVASLLGNSPSSVLLSCVTGLLLGIPLATECGINIIHFLDIVLGGAWWLMVLWVGQIFAIFLIRGRPYSADLLVNNLNFSTTVSAFIAFSWNLLIPIIFVLLGIIKYQTLAAWEFFNKRAISYWPLWVRQIGGFIQISFLVLVPITAVIQIYRYLSKGPPDVLDRIQLLYRPNLYPSNEPHRAVRRIIPPQVSTVTQSTNETTRTTDRSTQRQSDIDAPPKYTPPPSYTTATGARIAKMLRQSIRRSVRRIMGEPSRNRLTIPTMQRNANDPHNSLPPDYTAVFSINPSGEATADSPSGDRSIEGGSLSSAQTTLQASTLNRVNERRMLTATDVAQLLRPSRPKSNRTFSLGRNTSNQQQRDSANLQNGLSVSLENLYINAGNTKDDKCKSNDQIA